MSDEIEIPDKLYFRIGELSELLAVEPHVLRYWEQEFRIRPPRSESGQRMYRRKDIERFLRIKSLLYTQGFTVAGARRALADAKDDAPGTTDLGQLRGVQARLDALRERVRRLRMQVVGGTSTHGAGRP